MIEANTTYLWQTMGSIDARIAYTSVPVSSTNNIHADMGVFTPVSAFFVPGSALLPQVSA